MLAVTLGVHAAVEDEVKSAWREALKGQNLELETLDIFGHGSFKYNQNQYYEQLAMAWEQVPLPGLEDVFQQLKFNYQGGISLDLVSVQGQVTRATAEFQKGGDAAFFFCGMPTLLCIAFSAQALPVVHIVPAPVTVQIPALKFAHRPFLRALLKLVEDPKNHFAVNTHSMQSSVLYATGVKLPVLPFLGFHQKANYEGQSSRDILLHDRYSILRTYAWWAAMLETYPFRLVDLRQTDRRYETFARFRATVFFPYTLDGQYAFYELYAAAIPMLIPADPSWFLWPRVNANRIPESLRGIKKCPRKQQRFDVFVGKHEIYLKSFRGGRVYMNHTVSCSGRTDVSVANYELLEGSKASDVAELVEMEAMDERGMSHFLQARGGGLLKSHGEKCVRVRALDQGRYLEVFVGVPRGQKLTEAACASGPLLAVDWARGRYNREPMDPFPPPAIFADGLERVHRGSSIWFQMASLQKAKYLNPFDMISLRCLKDQWPNSPYAVYPHLTYFASAAELLKELLVFKPEEVSEQMRRWQTLRRDVGLKTWLAILEDVAWHPSQPVPRRGSGQRNLQSFTIFNTFQHFSLSTVRNRFHQISVFLNLRVQSGLDLRCGLQRGAIAVG